ncbi:MAG: hypothetical protein JWM65_3300 [Sphingomonas bacterium]|nr:hypothetical protein [Sphingomonas bacterium]
MYAFEADRPHGLLRIRLSGFWDEDTARAFAVDQQAAVAALGSARGQHLVLTDLSGFKIQSQEVLHMCKAFIDGAGNPSRRLALVFGEGLARNQWKRVLGRNNMKMFNTVREAEQWLLAPEAADATSTALAALNARVPPDMPAPSESRMFHVNYDRSANCLSIAVKGFWKPEDGASFAREVGAKGREAKALRGDFDACIETLDFPVQATEVTDLLAHIMQGAMSVTTGRVAVVVGSQLNRLQAERTLVHPRVRIFLTLAKARAWLRAPA